MTRSTFRITSLPILISLLIFSHFDTLHAQMFTVTDQTDRDRAQFFYRSLQIGWDIAEFTYTGDPEVAGQDRFDFRDPVLRLYFENPGIDMYLGIGGGITGMDDGSYINLGGLLYNNFILSRSDSYRLLLPLLINTDLTVANTDAASTQFRQTAFQIGSGLGSRLIFSDRTSARLQFTPAIGFSTAQGAFFGGTIYSLLGKARIHFDELFGSRGLLLGYDFRHSSYSIDVELFDYDYQGHSFSIGITF